MENTRKKPIMLPNYNLVTFLKHLIGTRLRLFFVYFLRKEKMMTAFNIQMNEELTPFHMIKEGNFQQYVSDVIGNIIYRYERRYNNSVLGIQYFLLETNGELVGEQYYPISECLHIFDEALTFHVIHNSVTKELYIQVQTLMGTRLLQLALITSTNKRIIQTANTTTEKLYDKLPLQKSTKEFEFVLNQIDKKHYSHLYK